MTLIAGLYVLVFPLSGTVTLTFVLAVWFLASGVLLLIDALSPRAGAASWAAAFGGVLSIVLGFLVAASVPSSAPWALGLLVGIDLIFWGVRALTAAGYWTTSADRRAANVRADGCSQPCKRHRRHVHCVGVEQGRSGPARAACRRSARHLLDAFGRHIRAWAEPPSDHPVLGCSRGSCVEASRT